MCHYFNKVVQSIELEHKQYHSSIFNSLFWHSNNGHYVLRNKTESICMYHLGDFNWRQSQ